jgi:nucleotide-binding universal stress UspA family protein
MAFRQILVPVIGTKADEEAIRLGCQLASKNRAKICVVYVITIKRALPLNAEIEPEIRKAEDVLDRMESVAEEGNYEITTDLIQARDAGPAIIDEAVEREIDLILIGIAYKTRFGQFSLGSVVPYILKSAPCRVILYHQPGK